MIHIYHLETAGHDRWDRPLFRHTKTGQFFCAVNDLDATLKDLRTGEELYFKAGGQREGEPEFPVRLCTRPVIRCTHAPESGMFHTGGIYPTFPDTSTATSQENDNLFMVKDNLGHWRVMTYDALRFKLANGAAFFEILEG